MLQFLQAITTTLAPVAPTLAAQVWDIPKLDKMIRNRGAITGLPSDNLNSQEDVDAVRADRTKQQQQQTKLDAALKGAQAAGAAAPFIKATSEATNGQNGQQVAA